MPDASVGADFQALARETWARYLAAFPRAGVCLGQVHLRAARDLADRATYDADTGTVTVRVPATAAVLQSALVHEWTHHLERRCPPPPEVKAAFLAAQGLDPATPWGAGTADAGLSARAWAALPSEQFAEAAVELALGRRQIPTGAPVEPAAVRVLARWAEGP